MSINRSSIFILLYTNYICKVCIVSNPCSPYRPFWLSTKVSKLSMPLNYWVYQYTIDTSMVWHKQLTNRDTTAPENSHLTSSWWGYWYCFVDYLWGLGSSKHITPPPMPTLSLSDSLAHLFYTLSTLPVFMNFPDNLVGENLGLNTIFACVCSCKKKKI